MDFHQRIEQSKEALRLEETPRAAYDAAEDMDPESMKRFINYLMEQKREDDLEKRAMRSVLEELSANVEKLTSNNSDVSEKLDKTLDELRTVRNELKAANKKAQKYEELYNRAVQELYGSRQKRASKTKDNKGKADGEDGSGSAGGNGEDGQDIPDRRMERDVYDGTGDSVRPEDRSGAEETSKDSGALSKKANADLSNRPGSYNPMDVIGSPIFHPCDTSGIKDVILDRHMFRTYSIKTVLEAHDFEMVKVRTWVTDPETGEKRRSTKWVYAGCPGHPQTIPVVEGTHATPEFMQALAYEVYMKGTTFGCLHKWLKDLGMSISKSTLIHWLRKGKKRLDKAVAVIKDIAVEKDSVLNCDETWCKVRRYDRYRKCYLWVVVNRENKVVIFFYDDGSRGSGVLRDFLGEAEIKCLVTDGYVGYKFVGQGLEHWGRMDRVVCRAHVRAKFVEAVNSGCHDPAPHRMLEYIDRLFELERQYRDDGLAADQITVRRQNHETQKILNGLYRELLVKINAEDEYRSPLLDTALKYLYNNWDNAVAYLKDGRYSIDNNAAERSVRPFCARRNSFEHFGSDTGAEMAACYHSVIGTLVAKGVSVWHGLGRIFNEVIDSTTDFLRVICGSTALDPA